MVLNVSITPTPQRKILNIGTASVCLSFHQQLCLHEIKKTHGEFHEKLRLLMLLFHLPAGTQGQSKQKNHLHVFISLGWLGWAVVTQEGFMF